MLYSRLGTGWPELVEESIASSYRFVLYARIPSLERRSTSLDSSVVWKLSGLRHAHPLPTTIEAHKTKAKCSAFLIESSTTDARGYHCSVDGSRLPADSSVPILQVRIGANPMGQTLGANLEAFRKYHRASFKFPDSSSTLPYAKGSPQSRFPGFGSFSEDCPPKPFRLQQTALLKGNPSCSVHVVRCVAARVALLTNVSA